MHTLERVSNDALQLTQQWIDQIRSMMDQGGEPGSSAGVAEMSMHDKAIVSGLLAKLMRAATGMIKEVRALQKDAREAADGMSLEDKRKFMVSFIAMLAPEEREKIRNELGWGGVATS